MPSSSSPEERHEAFVKVLERNSQLSHDANKYLKTSAKWRQHLLREDWASPADKQRILASAVDKVDACARAAVDYGEAVWAFAKALTRGESGEAELKRVPQARKRLVDSMAALK